MIRFILQRLLLLPLILAVVVVLTYAYAHTVQWEYAGRYGQLYQRLKVIEQRPEALAPAFKDYVGGLLRADLGTLRNGERISVVLGQAGVASLGLLLAALALSAPLGVLLGIGAAHWQQRRPARWLMVSATMGMAAPSFYIGSLLILFSVAYALWRGGGSPFPLAGFGWDRHMVFPLVALTLRPTLQIAQVTASLLTAELHKPYVTAARSIGQAWKTIKRRLAFRNVLAPVILSLAGSLRMLVTDLILVEWLFFWPGLGRFLAYALIPAARTNIALSPYFLDPAFTAALLTTLTLLFLLTDFAAAVLVRLFDPRLRVPVREEVPGV